MPAHGLDAGAIEEWEALERRAAEPNPCLSPYFLPPSLEHLTPTADVRLVVVESSGSEARWVAMGVFEKVGAHRRFPMPHWRLHSSLYSLLAGILVDRACTADALSALLGFLRNGGLGSTAIRWDDVAGDGPLGDALRASPAWYEDYAFQRACLRSPDWGEQYLDGHLRPSLRKEIRRKERQLRENGASGWRIVRGADVDERCIETFLRLEDTGWRHEERTSLRAVRSHEAFFRDMVRGCAPRDRIFFAELLRGDEVISSSSNLLAGNAIFAFKIGWDPAHARLSPGLLNEVALIRELPRGFPGLELLDSGAVSGSYLEPIYRGRRELFGGWLSAGVAGTGFLRALAGAKRIKRQLAARG